MFDEPPEDADDARAWFRYFRMTKHMPGMPMKFEAEMKRADTPARAKMVLTSYASAALDVVFFCGFFPPKELSRELEQIFKITPAQMMLLSVDEIAKPLKVGAEKVAERLKEGGFIIGSNGIITGFEPPAEVRKPSPRERVARKFSF